MKIVIVGAGALGGYVGAILSDAGVDVTLYDVREDYVKKVQAGGLTVSSPAIGGASGQSKTYKPRITSDLGSLGKPDVVIIATKAYHTRAAAEGAKSIIEDDTLVASFQNGLGNLAVIEEVLGGPERIIAMTTAHNFLVESPTHIVAFPGAGGVDLGPMKGEVTDRIKELGEIMKKLKVPVKGHEDGHEVVWNKILWNAVLNCTAAVSGLDVIGMVNTPPIQPVLKDLAAEYFAVSEKAGLKVWHPPNFVDLMIKAGAVAARVKTVASPKPSMLQDVEAGRETEIDYINGAIVEMGERLGVPTPVNKTMHALIKAIESKAKKEE